MLFFISTSETVGFSIQIFKFASILSQQNSKETVKIHISKLKYRATSLWHRARNQIVDGLASLVRETGAISYILYYSRYSLIDKAIFENMFYIPNRTESLQNLLCKFI